MQELNSIAEMSAVEPREQVAFGQSMEESLNPGNVSAYASVGSAPQSQGGRRPIPSATSFNNNQNQVQPISIVENNGNLPDNQIQLHEFNLSQPSESMVGHGNRHSYILPLQ